ncbi:MAG: glycosyltransferase family 4 protein [Bacteroidota bacterium]
MLIQKRIFYVVNVDWFFISHRIQLALAMKAAGHEVYILTKDTGRRNEIENNGLNFINIDFERSGKNPLKELSIVYTLIKYYREYKPEIVHHVTIKPAIYGSIAKRLSGCSDISVINAISGLGYNFIDGRNGVVQRILKRLMYFAFTNVNFIFQNPDDIQLYEKMGFLAKNKFKLIKGAGVDSEAFPYHLPLNNEKINITLTARMLYDKGISEYIEAAELLFEKWNGRAIFILAGDIDLGNLAGVQELELKKSMRDGYIEWIGHKKNIIPILVASDIVCLPSYREGLPKSLIEAMAIGRPIVSTDVPGCRECVTDGVNGFLVPVKNAAALADAIEVLLKDKDLRIKMGVASRSKMLNELSLDKVINSTLDFYKEIKS